MITLRRLHVENFKGLRSVELTFPEQGSILIEGHNEAGKSTLFEAVYVALYGEPLVGEENRPRQEDVIQHGQPKATVELTFTVGVQEMTVLREFRRASQQTQRAQLTIRRPDAEPETVNRPAAVKRRMLEELGNLDGESLRNSCFVEQKELGRLEDMDSAGREQAIQKLLGLDQLTKLTDQFKFRREQQQELERAKNVRDLAQLQVEARRLHAQEQDLVTRLDATHVASLAAGRAEHERDRVRTEQEIEHGKRREQALRQRLAQCDAVREQVQACQRVQQYIEQVSAQRRSVHDLTQQLSRLDHDKRQTRPRIVTRLANMEVTLQAVVAMDGAQQGLSTARVKVQDAQRSVDDLRRAEQFALEKAQALTQAHERAHAHRSDAMSERERSARQVSERSARRERLHLAFERVSAWEEARTQLEELERQRTEADASARTLAGLRAALDQREAEADAAEEAAAAAEHARQAAATRRLRAEGRAALQDWVRLKQVEASLAGYQQDRSTLETKQREVESAHAASQARARTPLLVAGSVSSLAVLIVALGLLWTPAFAIGIVLIIGAAAAWFAYSRARVSVNQDAGRVAEVAAQQRDLAVRYEAAVHAGGDPALLSQREREIRAAGLTIPTSLPDARAALDRLEAGADAVGAYQDAQADAINAASTAAALAAEATRARHDAEQARTAVQQAQRAQPPAEVMAALEARLLDQRAAVEAAAAAAQSAVPADLGWPVDATRLQTDIASLAAELRTIEQSQQTREVSSAATEREDHAAIEAAERSATDAETRAATLRASDPEALLAAAAQGVADAETSVSAAEALARARAQELGVQPERGAIEAERGRAQEQLDTLDRDLAQRPQRQAELERVQGKLEELLTAMRSALSAILRTAQALHLPRVDAASVFTSIETSHLDERQAQGMLATAQDTLNQALADLNETSAKNDLETVLRERGTLSQRVRELRQRITETEASITSLLAAHHLSAPQAYTIAALASAWPVVASVSVDELERVQEDLDLARKRTFAVREQAQRKQEELQLPDAARDALNVDDCERRVADLTQEREISQRAARLIQDARDRIARQVLPATERNMQLLLPELTAQRYWDVRLTPPEQENGEQAQLDYRIRVWDPMAGRYVAKNLFSGGTRDQCSLALRLAFALATLPQELGVAPGFIFLDEPLSAFDAQRAQALVDLLTTGTIARQFSQVVVISHHHTFDPRAFQYHVRMEGGRAVEHDLPEPLNVVASSVSSGRASKVLSADVTA